MRKIDFTKGWTFYKKGEVHKEKVSLPHDVMIHEERQAECLSGSAGGFFPGGIYYYEKEIEHVEELINQHVELLFEGVYKDAKVYLNDKLLAEHTYGYTPFSVVLDGKLEKNSQNILMVEVNNSQMPNSRWYTGSGIYRPVCMYVSGSEYIRQNGVQIKTTSLEPPCIQVTVEHTGGKTEINIKDGNEVIGTATGDNVQIELPEARMWDEKNPNQYTCHVLLKKDGKEIDEDEVVFGIRMITWNLKGLYVNGNETLLRGACVHHDNGILGACSYEVSEERRVRKLKEAGYNAIRSSHNPASMGMIRACDKLGMYLIDETCVLLSHKNS